MADHALIDDAQLQQILTAVRNIGSNNHHWNYTTAIPTFLAALLAFVVAILLDWLRTKSERKTKVRERREQELAKLSSTNTILTFNVETLIHTAMQQILPHYEASQLALNEIQAARKSIQDKSGHVITPNMHESMRRCPEPNLTDADLFMELSFLIKKDAQLLKEMGWVRTYMRHLQFVLRERNKLIDIATTGFSEGITHSVFERQIENQANVAIPEVVNCYKLFKALECATEGISNILSNDYEGVEGPKLKIAKPPIYDEVIMKLENIVKMIVPDFPPERPS